MNEVSFPKTFPLVPWTPVVCVWIASHRKIFTCDVSRIFSFESIESLEFKLTNKRKKHKIQIERSFLSKNISFGPLDSSCLCLNRFPLKNIYLQHFPNFLLRINRQVYKLKTKDVRFKLHEVSFPKTFPSITWTLVVWVWIGSLRKIFTCNIFWIFSF